MTFSKTAIASILLTGTVFAAPVADPKADANPQYYSGAYPTFFCPIVDSVTPEAGTPWQVGLDVAGGSSISVTETHSVGVTWGVGADLGISVGALSLGGSYSWAETVTDAVGEGTSVDCPPGNWRCSMQITPGMLHVRGHLSYQPDKGCDVDQISSWDGGSGNAPFDYLVPKKDDAGNGQWSPDICTCHNLPNWADPGHVALLCPQDCTPE